MRDETIIANGHEFTDKRMGLNSTMASDDNIFLDFHKGSDEGMATDFATVQINWLKQQSRLHRSPHPGWIH